MKLQNIKIVTRLALGFGMLLALMIVVAVVDVVSGIRTRSTVAEMSRTSNVVGGLKDLLLDVRNARALTWSYVASGDEKALKERERAFEKFAQDYAVVEALVVTERGKTLIADIRTKAAEFDTKQKVLIDLKKTGVSPSAPEFIQAIDDVNTLTVSYAVAAETAMKFDQALNEKARAAADDRLGEASFWSVAIGVIGVLSGVGFGWIISRSISRPVTAMTEAMAAIASGDLSVEVPALENKDEVGAMAKAVQIFKENGLRLKASEAEAARNRQAAEAERAANEATRLDLQRQQQAVVAALAGGLERLSKGDLTGRLDQAFSHDYEKLRADFNATAASLDDALRTIVKASGAIGSGSDEIAQASDDLSKRTEQQAASLEETAAALNVITSTVNKMAMGAAEAATVVATTRDAAASSGIVVQQAVDAMGKIKASSNQISQIIGVIDEIAFQTNLLALNAGVEAARAGDAGRGFAVVASEVRGLAQRSAEAAKEIKALISASSDQVEAGVVLVGRTGDALRGIIHKVSEMDTLVREISSSSKEQATGLAEVNIAVTQMDQVVQQNAAMVEESTAAAHALRGETEGLTSMVGRFRISGAADARGNPVHAAQARLATFARR